MTALFPPLERQAELKANRLSMSRGGALLFEGVSLNLGPGDVLWVKGDNGIGKTTLLEALSGLSRPETGTVNWQLDAIEVPVSHIAAYQPHRSFAKSALTAKEDLAFWAQIYGNLDGLDTVIESVGLKDNPSLFQEDFMDGNLAQYKMSGTSLLSLCAAKAISFAILSLAPLIGAIPSTALIFDMPPQAIIGTILSVIAAAPAIAVYGVFSAAILSGRRGGGFLIVLITAPFLIPLLIFGLGAVDSYASAGLAAVEFRALIGLSLIAIAVGLPAAAAALNANLE